MTTQGTTAAATRTGASSAIIIESSVPPKKDGKKITFIDPSKVTANSSCNRTLLQILAWGGLAILFFGGLLCIATQCSGQSLGAFTKTFETINSATLSWADTLGTTAASLAWTTFGIGLTAALSGALAIKCGDCKRNALKEAAKVRKEDIDPAAKRRRVDLGAGSGSGTVAALPPASAPPLGAASADERATDQLIEGVKDRQRAAQHHPGSTTTNEEVESLKAANFNLAVKNQELTSELEKLRSGATPSESAPVHTSGHPPTPATPVGLSTSQSTIAPGTGASLASDANPADPTSSPATSSAAPHEDLPRALDFDPPKPVTVESSTGAPATQPAASSTAPAVVAAPVPASAPDGCNVT